MGISKQLFWWFDKKRVWNLCSDRIDRQIYSSENWSRSKFYDESIQDWRGNIK